MFEYLLVSSVKLAIRGVGFLFNYAFSSTCTEQFTGSRKLCLLIISVSSSGVNLVWKLGGRGSGFENWGS